MLPLCRDCAMVATKRLFDGGKEPFMSCATFDTLFVGTYTQTGSKGVYAFRISRDDARLTAIEPPTAADNPSFLAVARSGRVLYATGGGGPDGGIVSAYAVGEDGHLAFLNRQPAGPAGPCHVTVTPDGRAVLAANYHDGLILTYPVEEKGRLGDGTVIPLHGNGPDPVRQASPHAHSVTLDTTGTIAVAADLGTDRLMCYRIASTAGLLLPLDPPYVDVTPGSGPRHVAFHPGGRTLYLKTEMGGTVIAYHIPEPGRFLRLQEISAVPPAFKGERAGADIHVHPSGRYLYCSNRNHDSITVFSIDGAGRLAILGYEPVRGQHPRNFLITPDGRHLLVANMHSDSIEGFSIRADGILSPIGRLAEIPMPSCLVIRST